MCVPDAGAVFSLLPATRVRAAIAGISAAPPAVAVAIWASPPLVPAAADSVDTVATEVGVGGPEQKSFLLALPGFGEQNLPAMDVLGDWMESERKE